MLLNTRVNTKRCAYSTSFCMCYIKMMKDVSDEKVIEEYMNGSNLAFKEIIDRYTTVLYGFVRRFGFNNEETEDILQNVFIKVWRYMSKFDGNKSSFKTWIFTITRNTIYDELRKKKDKNIILSLNQKHDDGNEIEIEDTDKDIVKLLERKENKKVLLEALEKLTFEEKNIILLHFEEGMTFIEIGEMFKMNLNTTKSKHRRAMIKLREILEKHQINN